MGLAGAAWAAPPEPGEDGIPVSTAGIVPDTYREQDGNRTCADLGFQEIAPGKVNYNNGVWTDGDDNVVDPPFPGISVTVTGGVYVAWSTTTYDVDAVIVKGGSASNSYVYVYPPGDPNEGDPMYLNSDSNLGSPEINSNAGYAGLSNLTFCGTERTVELQGTISGLKYYDANANGQFDAGEFGIPGWLIDWTNGVATTLGTYGSNPAGDDDGKFIVEDLDAGTYTFTERQPNAPTTWMQTGNTVNQTNPPGKATLLDFTYTVTLEGGDQVDGLNFGNVCLGAGGGKTLGFWSNRNGKAEFENGNDLAKMVELNLRNADGTHFNPANYTAFRTWLLSANATNMAYMLSAQLAAMKLNVYNGFVSGSALIYAPGTNAANAAGFATVSAIIAEANAELGANGLVLTDSPDRAYQEALKDALDNANNNYTFVQTSYTNCPEPDFSEE